MELLNYYRYLVDGVRDPYISNFPLLYGGPWKLLFIISLYLSTVLYFGPRFMKQRKKFDLRPYLVIFNGFIFGTFSVGLVIALWLTGFTKNSWSCASNTSNDILEVSIKYTGVMYLYFLVLELFDDVFKVFRKSKAFDIGVVAHKVYFMITFYCVLKLYPYPVFYFAPIANIIQCLTIRVYFVLKSPGSLFEDNLVWKRKIIYLQIALCIITVIHGFAVIYRPICKGPTFIKWMFVMDAFCSLITHLYRLNRPKTVKKGRSQN